MIKKFTAVLCVLAMLITLAPLDTAKVSAAEGASTEEKILSGLGIYNDSITKYDGFIKALSGFLFDNPGEAGTTKEFAEYAGLIEKGATYKGSSSVTYADAIKFAVTVLGYGDVVKSKGGTDSDYLIQATSLQLLKGINQKANAKITKATLVKLLYNMTKAEPMQKDYNNKEAFYVIGESQTLLWVNRKIYKVSGLLTATEHTSLYGPQGTDKAGRVQIGDELFRCEEGAYDDLLGYNVEAYVQVEKDEDEAKVLYLGEKEGLNSVLEISAEDLDDVSNNFSEIKYYTEKGTKKSAKLKAALRVIYNGTYYGDYTKDDLLPDIGSVKLLDNNGDGTFEVAKINSYKTIIVDSIDSEDGVINNRYAFSGALNKLEIDKDEDTLLIYKGDDQIALSAIKTGDVLSVAESKGSGDKVIKIYVSNIEPFEGRVAAIDNSEDEVTVDDVEYKQSAELKKYLENTGKTLDLGKEYIFSIDFFGEIAYIKATTASDYVLVRKMYRTGFGDEDVNVNYLDLNNEWHTALLAQKVTLNGAGGKNPLAVYNAMKDNAPEVFKLKLNAKGEVVSVDSPEEGVVDEEKFTKRVLTASTDDWYRYRSESKSIGFLAFVNSDAKVFIYPEDSSKLEDYAAKQASAFFAADRRYENSSITAYDISEYKKCSLFAVKMTETNKAREMSSLALLVTDKGQTMGSDGNIYPVIQGYRGVFEDISFTGDDASRFDGISIGDFVNVHLNSQGRVDKVSSITINNSVTDYHNHEGFIEGTILGIDFEEEMFKVKHGDIEGCFPISSSQTVLFYDKAKNKCTTETAARLKAGDEVMVYLYRGTVSSMYCFE